MNTTSGFVFTNYLPTEGVYRQEAVLTDVDRIFKKLTLNKILPFVQGPYKIYNSIACSLVYSPHSFGDPLSLKQIREATAMFANKAFTAAKLGFSSDLFPGFKDVEFSGDGAGLFGQDDFGSTFFGGASNSIPLRTYVPADCQRCRYLNIRFSHNTARERFALYGITLTGRSVSTRAYR